jgi:dipeptidyl aminopeptidase/acylaminoacyl peptidase
MRSVLFMLALATSASWPLAAPACPERAFTVDDLVSREAIGAIRVSPNGQWVAIEERGDYASAASFRLGFYSEALVTSLSVRPTEAAVEPIRLESEGGEVGYISGPFSPSGQHMVVYRLTPTTLRLGVLSLADGHTEWFGITPDMSHMGRTIAWRSEREIVLVARALDDFPILMRLGFKLQDRVSELWRAAASGRASSSTVMYSGSLRDQRAQANPSMLMVLNVESGEQRVLGRGEWFDISVSPDGRAVAALFDGADVQPPSDRLVQVGDAIRRRHLAIADLETGVLVEPLSDEDFATHLLAWSTNSSQLLAFGRPSPASEFDTSGRYWLIDRSGRAVSLNLGTATPWIERSWDGIPIPMASWDGDVPLVQARTDADDRVWLRLDGTANRTYPVVERGERIITVDGQAAVARSTGVFGLGDGVLIASGRLAHLGQASDGGPSAAWNPDPNDPGRLTVIDGACLTDLPSLERTCLPSLAGGGRIVAVHASLGLAVESHISTQGVSEIRLHTRSEAGTVAVANRKWESIAWGERIPIDHTGPNGEPLVSWLLLPPCWDSASPPPVVVEVYPGLAYGVTPGRMSPGTAALQNNPAVIAGAGYAVLIASLPHGADGTGRFDDLADRILSVVDEAGRQRLVDPNRVALIGHSYGAHAALRAATQSDRFDVVIASNGYADLTRSMEPHPFYRAAPDEGVPIGRMVGWGESGQGAIGAFHLDPFAYAAESPLFSVGRIHGAVLLMESDLDVARFASIFGSLYRLGREAALVTYYGEGHNYLSPGNIRDSHHRILDWLTRYLPLSNSLDPFGPVAGPGLDDRME